MQQNILSLANNLIQVDILPSYGGKITSLRSVRTNEEFVLPALKSRRELTPSSTFDNGDRGGFDECLPSVAACSMIAGEPAVPDHGDLWRSEWDVERVDAAIVLRCEATSRPLRLTRRASLRDASLVLEYELLNLSDRPTNWLWSAHPLLSVEPGDKIVLPDHVGEVLVEYSAGGVLPQGGIVSWPIAASASNGLMDLSRMDERDGRTAHKLFARIDQSGWAGLYRQAKYQGVGLRFSPDALPYLGIWVSSGAWPDADSVKQFTVALEPTTANKDSLSDAIHNGSARTLSGRDSCSWQLEFELLGASSPVSLSEFRLALSGGTSLRSPNS